jgi:hypothetical protein
MKRLINYAKSPEGLLISGLTAMMIGIGVSLAQALTRLY